VTPWLDDGDVRLFLGDCIEVLAEMDAESVDAVVCDPPYGLEFMGKDWDAPWKSGDVIANPADVGGFQDGKGGNPFSRSRIRYGRGKVERAHEGTDKSHPFRDGAPRIEYGIGGGASLAFQQWVTQWATEALRVLKPGGHLLAFGGTRTFHRLTCGIEDAGFEVRDCLSWLYGSGFPKSLDVSKAIDKKRDDHDDVLAVTAEIARLRDAVGMTNRDLDAVFGFAGMAGHWTSVKSQPAIPTVEQWAALREMLDPPAWVEAEVWRLNGRKGEPGEAWKSRPVTGQHDEAAPAQTWKANYGLPHDLTAKDRRDIPATDAAREWQGWGTALKPAWEPCVVARKPLAGTVAENVQAHGTGALNVDGCRIPHASGADLAQHAAGVAAIKARGGSMANSWANHSDLSGANDVQTGGRWPANVALDEAAAAMLDAQSGERPGATSFSRPSEYAATSYKAPGGTPLTAGYADTGGASRFYYTAKASRADRSTNGANNTHPTVKPTDLMRWLVRLVTPPGGVVLDPFAGSGSTLVAARAEGFRAVGIEREQEYADIIAARLSQLSLFTEGME
jgi:DNA modification methylase